MAEKRRVKNSQSNNKSLQSLTDLEKRIVELSVLYELSSIPAVGLNMEEIFNTAMDKATRLMKAERAALFLLDELTQKLIIKVGQGFGREDLKTITIEPGEGFIGQAFKEGRPINLWNQGGFRRLDPFIKRFPVKSAMITPIKVGEKFIGVLYSGRLLPQKFTSEELRLFTILADRVGVAIENARLFEKEKQHRQQLSDLQTTSTAIISELNLKSLLQTITDKAAQTFNAPAVSLMFWDEKEENLIIKASFGLSDEYVKSQRIPKDRVNLAKGPEGKFVPFVTSDIRLTPFGDVSLIKRECLCTVLTIPLLESSKLIGVGALNIYSKDSPRVFSSEDIELAQIFAYQASIAIENARLFEREKEVAKQLRAISEMGRVIISSLETENLFKQAVDLVENVGPYPFVFGLLLDKETNELVQIAKAGRIQDKIPSKYKQKITEGVVGRAVVTGEIQISGDVSTNPYYLKWFPEVNSEISVPIKTRFGEVIGVLDVQSDKFNAFREDDITTIQTITDQLSVAVENLQLYKDLEKRVNELSSLYAIAQSITSILTLDDVLNQALAKLRQVVPSHATAILLFDPSLNVLKVKAFSGPSITGLETIHFKPGQGITGTAYQTKKGIIVPDVEKDPRYITGFLDIRSEIAVPLIYQDEILGVLNAESKEINAYNEDHLRIVNYFANQVAIAIRNAQLFEETQRLAATDPLTGVWNRGHVEKLLKTELERAHRFHQEFSVLLIDLDNLKFFNDTYGHSAGDKVICMLAQLLLNTCREIDIVGRYGGDEFVVILPETDAPGATVVGERILTALKKEAFWTPKATRVPINITIGVASYPSDADEVDRLLSLADAAMYRGRVGGGGRFSSLTARPREEPEPLSTRFDVLEGLLIAIDSKDHYTFRHSQEVTKLALALGQKVGLSPEEMRMLEIAGKLHDVGKIGIPSNILNKPGVLNPEEWKAIQEHPRLGYLILQQIQQIEQALQVVLLHHERYNGEGYPSNLKGEDIPLLARILAIADAFSAMQTDRPYRKALTPAEAVHELLLNAGKQFDPELVEKFIELVEKGEISSS
ncbi:MAG: Cyclic di-GMP phosphodiesterase response regulator RpfG [candidate division WS2 bacterium]|nr:Cyclic di-GMP phosphodiesterase response regulator RpfG [Candidatus Lithacetigena glycinireducens]